MSRHRLTGQRRERYPVKKMIGQEFGALLVMGFDGRDENNHTYWRCYFSCGTFTVVRTDNLISGRTRSCDCKQNRKV